MYLSVRYKDVRVKFLPQLNGGGSLYAYEFVHVVSQKIGKVEHVFEYCAGPGFIGFCLLANNLCDRLTLADVNPEAIEAIHETIKINNLQNKVTVYQSDCLDAISKNEKWDLVVSNPPWLPYGDDRPGKQKSRNLILHDPGNRVHKKFYQDINKFLNPNGSIFFLESKWYTNVNIFAEMIGKNDLKIIDSFKVCSYSKILEDMDKYKGLNKTAVFYMRLMMILQGIYFVWVRRKDDF